MFRRHANGAPGVRRPGNVRWLVLAGTVSPYLLELFERLGSLGDSVLFLSRPRDSGVGFEHERLSKTERMHHLLVNGYYGTSWRTALDYEPDVVIVMGYMQAGALALAAHLHAKRGVVTLYFGDTNGHQLCSDLRDSIRARALLPLKRFVLRHVFDASLDLGLTNSVANRALGIETGLLLPLYSTDFAALDHANDSVFPLPECSSPRVLCVARLVPQKNLTALIAAWTRWIDMDGTGCLLIAGEGPERARLELMTSALPCNRVRLLGPWPRPDIGSLLGQVDGLVLPSLREPWGIVVIEALGLGIPVLATTPVGSATSLVAERLDGIRICAPDESSLSEALGSFMERLDAGTRVPLSTQSAIRERYGMDQVARRLHQSGARWILEGRPPNSETA